MKVADLLETRRAQWTELNTLCHQMETRSKARIGWAGIHRFAVLYRAVCADLALADSYQLPASTVSFLHQLVARAHNQLYRSRKFRVQQWAHRLLVEVPQELFADNCFRVAFLLFWALFLLAGYRAYHSEAFTESILTKPGMEGLKEMYDEPLASTDIFGERTVMAGFYVQHNAGIGLQTFAFGLLGGVMGLFVMISNALQLGVAFGFMCSQPQRENFLQFVTAHGPFELTAIVLCTAAGMRLGLSMFFTRGWTRSASVQMAGRKALPMACMGVLLFMGAAMIEAFVSPVAIPYAVKAGVGTMCGALLVFYFVVLGFPRK